MIDRQAVHALLEAGQPAREIALQLGVSQRSIQRIARELRVEEAGALAQRRRDVGRPAVPSVVKEQLRKLLFQDPHAPPLEYLRQLREQGMCLGKSTFYRILRSEKGKLPAESVVRVRRSRDRGARP